MSRSRRKTPIFGVTSAKSEKQDKQIWHSRLRSRVRTDLASVPPDQLECYIAPVSKEVSSVWSMAKDGRRYFHPANQAAIATRVAARGKTSIERQSLKIRLLKKWAMK
jgi:hypothetical protein